VTLLVAILLFAAFTSGPHTDTRGPCIGGPKIGVPAKPLGDGRYRVECVISGSEIARFDDGPTPSP